ncbi:hypothetical protein CAPTEDRAFT_118401 [Capitella teleta]|uniref:Endonuclease/exonuclease/phosphatase domain-containing protein n=1 Tax=Capitella teleta TaxID=283909 RepID=R7UAN1_CAPTE|nr:hypothetical protein CAPTEDRAFT_118401 [Capitella teleta]|eukprot:ELU03024.1 hypothetical protein CAPTEDRAFT_118401 [Capitella teleta]
MVQVYAPTADADEIEKEVFYGELNNIITENKKYDDVLIVCRDFNSKVGCIKEDDVVGLYGLGVRNESGDRLVDFERQNDLFITNTWFQQKIKSRHIWNAPNGITNNQIDFILISKIYRNSVTNCKTRQDVDCGSDHAPFLTNLRVKLKTEKTKT